VNLHERKVAGAGKTSVGEATGAGKPTANAARTKSGVRARPAGLNRSVTRALDLLRYVAHAPTPQQMRCFFRSCASRPTATISNSPLATSW
jgi:hypothetical protein